MQVPQFGMLLSFLGTKQPAQSLGRSRDWRPDEERLRKSDRCKMGAICSCFPTVRLGTITGSDYADSSVRFVLRISASLNARMVHLMSMFSELPRKHFFARLHR